MVDCLPEEDSKLPKPTKRIQTPQSSDKLSKPPQHI